MMMCKETRSSLSHFDMLRVAGIAKEVENWHSLKSVCDVGVWLLKDQVEDDKVVRRVRLWDRAETWIESDV